MLRFEVSGETLAAFREAMAWLREQSGEALDDDAALLMLARAILCGAGARTATDAPASETALGRPRYQITLTECEHCQRGYQRAGADQVEVEPAMIEAARCDALISREAMDRRAHVDAMDEPGRQPTTGSPRAGSPVATLRARATIPPAVRRRVVERDRRRCQIPGCRHTLDLDVHHIRPRADGGTHAPRYLITLCGAHHRAVHAGRLQLSGMASALCARHADGSSYGAGVTASAAANAAIAEKGVAALPARQARSGGSLSRWRHDVCDGAPAIGAIGALTRRRVPSRIARRVLAWRWRCGTTGLTSRRDLLRHSPCRAPRRRQSTWMAEAGMRARAGCHAACWCCSS